MVHGSRDVVNYILDHKDIRAVSFVGSDAAGKYIYERGAANGKRVQSNQGAKNHAVIMPDADVDSTVKALAGAAFGAAGQRCMAISAAGGCRAAPGLQVVQSGCCCLCCPWWLRQPLLPVACAVLCLCIDG